MKKTKKKRRHNAVNQKIEPLDLVNPGDDLVSSNNRRTLCTSTYILVMPEFKSIFFFLFFFKEIAEFTKPYCFLRFMPQLVYWGIFNARNSNHGGNKYVVTDIRDLPFDRTSTTE